jgi:hypothetical protein
MWQLTFELNTMLKNCSVCTTDDLSSSVQLNIVTLYIHLAYVQVFKKLYIYICIYMYVCMYVCVCVYIHTYTHTLGVSKRAIQNWKLI